MLDQYLHHFYFFRKGLFTNMENECHSIFVMVALLEFDEAKNFSDVCLLPTASSIALQQMLHLEHLVWWEGWLSSETSDSSHLVSQPASSSVPRHLKLVAVIVSLTSFGGTLLNWAWLLATQNHIQQSFSKPLWRNSDLFKSIKLGSLKKVLTPRSFSAPTTSCWLLVQRSRSWSWRTRHLIDLWRCRSSTSHMRGGSTRGGGEILMQLRFVLQPFIGNSNRIYPIYNYNNSL